MRWIAVAAACLVASGSARADWGPHRDPFDPQVVHRYEAILSHDPHDEHALGRLVAMYAQYRTVAQLETEYRARLTAGDDWATLVVLARLPRTSRQDTLAWWKRALAAKPDDERGWLAAGDAEGTNAAAARDDYRHAADLATAPKDRRLALTRLVGAAQVAGDLDTADRAFGELIALAPKDGLTWLERGNVELAAKRFAAARTSFVTAESLLASDPERRLEAMMDQGVALASLGEADAAIAQFRHTLDRVPTGYFLGPELVTRIVDIERRRGRLADAIAWFEGHWPERTRGYFEWSELGDLYDEAHDPTRAIAAYRRAVARAPTEVTTQRKLIHLLDQVSPADALAQHEIAARWAPGDADLQIALARRYYPDHRDQAFATLDALARCMSGSVSVHEALAALYEEWNQSKRAIREYEAIARLEPDDPDHAVVLGEAYWQVDDQTAARAAWQRLDKIGTAVALFRYGEVLGMHEVWPEALAAYTRSLALDGGNADAWYGRARTNDALGRYADAIDDARRAVALGAYATEEKGLRDRQLLVRELGHAYEAGDHAALARAVAGWRFAFEHGDVAAGYLLAAHHERLRSDQLHAVLVQLYRLAPADDSLGLAVARSFEHRGEYARARAQLEHVAHRNPARAKQIAKLVEDLEQDRVRRERELRWEEEGGSPTSSTASPDLVGRFHRWGARLSLGSEVGAGSGALLGIGMYRTSRVAPGTALGVRLDWTKLDDRRGEVDAVALGGGLATRIVDARKLEVAVAATPRIEVHYGYPGTAPRDRFELAGALSLELLPRAVPANVALRFDQAFTGPVKSSALLLELGFEVR